MVSRCNESLTLPWNIILPGGSLSMICSPCSIASVSTRILSTGTVKAMDVFGPQDNSQSTVEDQARVLGGVRISCIIPTLGRGKILCETIEMLLAQSHAAHEIIIIDQTEDTEAS